MDDAFDIYRHVLDDLREVDDELAARCLFEAVAQGFTNPANARMAQQYRARLRRLSANGNVAPIVELDTAFELAAGGRDASRVVLLATGALRKLTEANEYSGALIAAFFCLVWADQAPTVVTAITTALEQSSPGKLDYLSFYRQAALSARAMALNRCGELLRAEDDARSSIDRTMSPGFLLESLTEQGRLQDAADLLDDRALAGDLPDRLPSAILLPSRAKFHLARNQPERAVEDLRQCSRIWSGMHGLNPACCTWRSQLALVLDRLGDHCQAAELAQEELVRARAFGAASAIGTALRAVALVGQASERVELLDGAVTALGRSPSRLEHARALLDLGRALRQAGERAKAREDLALAMDLAHRCGARPLAEQAREELVIAGARPRRQRVTGADALTASERRIATMAADGMTNREIAQALFITTKTVAHHLTHIYDKLGIVGRRELAQALKAE
jgi:DNA-binding CsgD family transcriptional regulator